MQKKTIRRRDFLKISGMSGIVLAVGYYIPSWGKGSIVTVAEAEENGLALNDFIIIDTSGKITLVNHRPEMGQGVYQAMPMLLAEELAVDMDKVNVIQSQADFKKYGHQQVGGSSSVRRSWEPSRKMGAAAREMLKQAAASRWNVTTDQCYAEDGHIINKSNGKKLSYGELVEEASKLTPPQDPPLKPKSEFKVLGKPLARKDIPLKTNGEAKFGQDIKTDSMLYASVERSPVFHGKVKSFDDSAAKQVPGVKAVVKTEMPVFSHIREGVAVIADSYYAALQGRKKLKIEWDEPDYSQVSTESIFKQYREEARKPGITAHQQGDFEKAFAQADKKIEGTYEAPFQAHSPMEPMNIVVSVTEGKCELWGSIQSPNWIRNTLAEYLNLKPEDVTINVSFLGGGFGRRAFTDFPVEAAFLSREMGAPVKVVWTREDDTTQGPFRPATLNTFRAGFDKDGNVTALEKKAVYQELGHQWPDADKEKVGPLEGANKAYEIPNTIERVVPQHLHIPVMWWRSVYASTNGFAMECFVDEMAHAAGKDPVDFRLGLLKNEPRYVVLLKTLKEKSGWKSNQNAGYGVAIVESFGSICGQVVEVSRRDGKLHINKVTAVIDCGMYVNPDTIRAQIEGSVVMGLTAAVKSEINFANGRAVETNFDKFKMLRINECPVIETHIMENEEAPGGVGEPGLPPLAPALVNAIFHESGKRIRKLPFELKNV